MYKAVLTGFIVLLLAAAPAVAATINVGTHKLLPNTANQPIQITVVAGNPAEQVAGMNLFAQIADGGPDLPPPVTGTIDGPEFSGADLLTGTIWNIQPQPTVPALWPGNQVIVAGVILGTQGSTVPANGLVATLYVDTTGWGPDDDPWELKMAPGTTIDPTGTQLLDGGVPTPNPIPLTITNGMIWVPEPSSVAMLIGLLAVIPLLAWKRRNSRG